MESADLTPPVNVFKPDPAEIAQGVVDLAGVRVHIDVDGASDRFAQSGGEFYMAKSPVYLDSYAALLEGRRVRSILEVGVFRGGSMVYFDRVYRPDLVVGVDWHADPLPRLREYIASQAFSEMHLHQGVHQASRADMEWVIDRHFKDGVDLVVDDASHWYEETKATFEIVFPHVRPGGVYVVEDPDWASGPLAYPGSPWHGKRDCMPLYEELKALSERSPELMPEVAILPGFFYVRRGEASADALKIGAG
jgi:predicted O-methyltransferase YrrM